jgi:hypothetical protein
MTSTRQIFLSQLSEFEAADLFLTDEIDTLETEIFENSFSIGLTKEIVSQVSSNDIEAFLAKVKSNRLDQLNRSQIIIDLIYYLWFDEMAGQLRLNFINSNHKKLPFSCNLTFVDEEKEIIDSFLKCGYSNEIPLTDQKDTIETKVDGYKDDFNLKIYRESIRKNETI